MRTLAIVVPTYNRPNSVMELIERYDQFCQTHEIGLFFYDSSENDLTERIFDNLRSDRIFYYRLPSELHSGKKVYQIYEEFSKNTAYDYVWLHQDSIYYDAGCFQSLFELFESDYHMVIVAREIEGPRLTEYTSPQHFFDDNLWETTLFGATVVSRTLLQTADFGYLHDKYIVPMRINFSHIGLYFEQILRVEHFRACRIIGCKLENIKSRRLSGWAHEVLDLWLRRFPYFVNSLPDVYQNKRKAIITANRKGGVFAYMAMVAYGIHRQILGFGLIRTLIAWRLYSGFGYTRLLVYLSYTILRKLGLLPLAEKIRNRIMRMRSSKRK